MISHDYFCRLPTSFSIKFFKKDLYVGPDLDPNCLQRLSADDKEKSL